MSTLPSFVVPSLGSTLAFLGIIVVLCLSWIWALRRAWPSQKRKVTAWGVAALVGVLGITAGFAATGVFARTIGTPRIVVYIVVCNLLAVGLAMSTVGKRFVDVIPVAALIGVQGFRLPLELVLHEWHTQGTLPIQMTYSGDNWDIVTGISALLVAVIFPKISTCWQWRVGAGFTLLGLGLLSRVISIAARSLPWPLRTYLNDPPVLLPFHAPYTWILPMCVAGALFGHVVVLRWLWTRRGLLGSNSSAMATPLV